MRKFKKLCCVIMTLCICFTTVYSGEVYAETTPTENVEPPTENVEPPTENVEPPTEEDANTSAQEEKKDVLKEDTKKIDTFGANLTSSTATDQQFFQFKTPNTITGIMTALPDGTSIPSDIVIPETYTDVNGDVQDILYIGNNAFSGKGASIDSITLNSNLETIGEEAFKNLMKITRLDIPNSVTTIGKSAFEECTNLATLTISTNLETIPERAFFQTSITNLAVPNSVKSIGSNAFASCGGLATATLGNQVTSIGAGAFQNTAIATITIPDSVETIGAAAFRNCTKLTQIVLGEKVNALQDNVLSGTKLASITIPASVKSIDKQAFYKVETLTSVLFDADSTLKSIGDNTFEACKGLTGIDFPDSLTTIGINAFSNCTSLKDVTFGEQLESIGNYAMYETALTTINLPDSLQIIGEQAFRGSDVNSLDLGEGVTKIGPSAFYNTKLITVDIPASVTDLGDSCFSQNQALSTVTLHEGLERIGKLAFYNTIITNISVPKTVQTIGLDAFHANNVLGTGETMKTITLDKNFNEIVGQPWGASKATVKWKDTDATPDCFYFKDGEILAIKDKNHTGCTNTSLHNTNSATLTIPETISGVTVTKIGDYAFQTKNYKTVVLPSTITRIGDYAFKDCTKLTTINLVEAIEDIGEGAFYNAQLSSIEIPSKVTIIKKSTFYGNAAASINFKGNITEIQEKAFTSDISKATDLVLPDSVETIGKKAFWNNTRLVSIKFGTGLKTIGESAFWGCTGLTTVKFGEGLSTIGSQAFMDTGITTLVLPNSLATINSSAFENCSKLQNLTFGTGLLELGTKAFTNCILLKSVEIPNSLTKISDGAFSKCAALETVVLQEGLKTLGTSMFKETAIKEIIIPNSLNILSTSVFDSCSNFKTVTWGTGIHTISDRAFANTGLKELELPNTITYLGNSAFSGCTALAKVKLGQGLQTIKAQVFAGTAITSLNRLPDSLIDLDIAAFKDSNIDIIMIDKLSQETSYKNNQPWGATSSKVYWKNDIIDMSYNVTKDGYKRTIDYTFTAQENAGLIHEITLPDNSKVQAISNKTYSGSYEVTANNDYSFAPISSTNAIFPYDVEINDIGKITIDGNDLHIKKADLDAISDVSKILTLANVKAMDVDLNTEIIPTLDKTLADIKTALINNGDSITVTITASNTYGSKTKTISIILDENSKTVEFMDGSDVIKIESIAQGGKLRNWTPVKDLCTFAGWYKEAGLTTSWNFESDTVDADTKIYSKWNWYTFTLHYDTKFSDISIADRQNVSANEDHILPTAPSKVGYTFDGWKYNSAPLSDTTKLKEILSNEANGSTITFDAGWSLTPFTIKYEGIEGSSTSNPTSYNIESPTFTLSNPTAKAHYTFAGWYDGTGNDANRITQIPQGTTGNQKLYARWTADTYRITYENLLGATTDNVTSYTIDTPTITLKDPTVKAGYTFEGWFENLDPTANRVRQIIKGTTGAITLYAKWSITDFTLTYANLQGAENDPDNPKKYNVGTETITLKDPGTRTGYSFVGWFADEGDTASQVMEIPKGTTGNKTLYARWTTESYTLSYDNLLGATTDNLGSYNIETPTITLKAPTARTGYTFEGWFDGTSSVAIQVTQIVKGTTGNKTLYAKWSVIPYAITYENLQGATNSNLTTYNVETAAFKLKAPGARAHYTFAGWFDGDGAGDAASEVTEITLGSTGEKTLYARWTANTYGITYDNLQGTTTNNATSYTIDTPTIKLNKPTERNGYTFNGWYDDATPIAYKVTEITKGTTGAIKLHATWTPVKYDITYKELKDGNNTNADSYTIETTDIMLTNMPDTNGYNFVGWFDGNQENANQITKIALGSTGNLDLYARYENKQVEVSLQDGDAPLQTNTVYFDKAYGELPTLEKVGYTFDGWYSEQDGKGDQITSETIVSKASKHTLYANWKQVYYENEKGNINIEEGQDVRYKFNVVETEITEPMKTEKNLISVYDIYFLLNDERITIKDKKMTITIDLKEAEKYFDYYKVVYFDKNGNAIEEFDPSVAEDYSTLTFETDHLSYYGIVAWKNELPPKDEGKSEQGTGGTTTITPPKDNGTKPSGAAVATGDTTMDPKIYIGMLIISLLVLGGVVRRKRTLHKLK